MKKNFEYNHYHKNAEPTYAIINGAWLNNLAYGVVHRVASDGVTKGAGTFCIQCVY